jgi:outer membrane protein assembly factor BamB
LKTIDPVLPEDEFSGMGMPQHGYASHTPVSDGERVYVFFGKTGAMAFDKDGNQLWRTQVGAESDPRRWGSASSPILYNNLLIVTAPAESEALLALDKETGRQVWRKEARGFSNTWGSPILVQVDGSRADLVLGVPYEIWGFDPRTGKLQWYCEAMQTDTFCSSAIAEDGVVYAIEGLRGGSIAVRAGGAGDVRDTHVVWTGRDNNRIATPILFEGRIYFFSNRIANCISAKTGERIYQERLSGGSSSSAVRGQGGGRFGRFGGMGGQDYASPVIADGKIFYTTRSGTVYVIKSGPDFAQLAANQMTNDVEDFSATPAVSDGELFLRSSKRLYCVAQGKSAP